MVLEAAGLGCVDEVIVIAAALSIQDVRERPADQQAQADQAHARHADDSSRLPRLPEPLALPARAARRAVASTSSASRPRASSCTTCGSASGRTSSASSARRPRASASRSTTRRPSRSRSTRRSCPGCSRTSASRTPAGASTSAPATRRFALWPGTGVKGQPSWVMVAELVETSRLWGRTVARIDPRWVEPLAGHLIKRTYEEPRWERKRAQVVATERVTLYGLPIVAGRTVAYGRIDPALSRDLFIRRALVEGEWDTRHHFFAENQRAGRGGRGARGARAPARHPRRRPGAVRLLRRARPRADRLRRPLRPLVARRAARPPGPAHVHARAADQPDGGRGRRGPAGRLAPGRDWS